MPHNKTTSNDEDNTDKALETYTNDQSKQTTQKQTHGKKTGGSPAHPIVPSQRFIFFWSSRYQKYENTIKYKMNRARPPTRNSKRKKPPPDDQCLLPLLVQQALGVEVTITSGTWSFWYGVFGN